MAEKSKKRKWFINGNRGSECRSRNISQMHIDVLWIGAEQR
jgi:hypothetical protein